MKRIKLFASVVLMASMFLSCSGLPSQRTNMLSDQVRNEHEAMSEFEEDFLEALVKEDGDKIEACFSKKAKERTDDLNEGIEYVFELYNGNDNPEVIDDNVSDYRQFNARGVQGANTWEANCYCYIKAGNEYYILRWKTWLENGLDSDLEGVYAVRFDKYDAGYIENPNSEEKAEWNKANTFYHVAGIYHPGRQKVQELMDAITRIQQNGWDQDTSHLSYDQIVIPEVDNYGFYFSEELSDSSNDELKKYVLLFLLKSYNNNLGDMWIKTEDDETAIYVDAKFTYDYGILGIGIDSEGKIKGFLFENGAEDMTGMPEGISGFESIAEALGD